MIDTLTRLFDADVAVACAATTADDEATLYPVERARIARAIGKRRAEFATARRCAREALAQLGVAPAPLLSTAGGAPAWPEGIVGSLTHSDGLCAAVVARRERVRALGVDVERRDRLPARLESVVCTPYERRWLAGRPAGERLRLAQLLFSAKESFYKCQHPLSGQMLGFLDVTLAVDEAAQTFQVVALRPSRLGDAIWRPMRGRFCWTDQFVVTGMSHPGHASTSHPGHTAPLFHARLRNEFLHIRSRP